jgi:uncharacterized integral membrane protein
MQFFYWFIFLIAIGITIFAVQNSNAPPVMIKVFLWQFETSLIYTLLGSIGLGILITLFFWIPRAIRSSIRSRKLRQEIKNLETMLTKPASLGHEGNQAKEA